jgi:hypothetical protein
VTRIVKQVTKGRRLTKVDVQVTDDGGELSRVKPQLVTVQRLPAIKAESLAVLAAAGIDPTDTLTDSPHGSGLRDLVINALNHPADSVEGLAARIYERAAHVESYFEMGAIEQAMNQLGALAELYTIFCAYRTDSEQTRNARAHSKGRTRAPLRETLKDAFKQLRSDDAGMTQSLAIESLAASGYRSLRLKIEGNLKQMHACQFMVEDEDGDGAPETLTWDQLKELYKKKSPKKKRGI